VAHGAGLILLGLVVEGRDGRSSRFDGERVALQAKQIHLAALEQSWIRGAMRRVAGHAAFDLHRFVLVDERTRLV